MNQPAVIDCEYINVKPIFTRGVWQIWLEIPAEASTEFLLTFGTPSPSEKKCLALANVPAKRLSINEHEQQKAENHADLKQTLQASIAHEDEKAKPRRAWSELSRAQQAGIACNEKGFWTFLLETFPQYFTLCTSAEDAAHIVRQVCGRHLKGGLQTRKELDTDDIAGREWDRLHDRYSTWLRVPA